MELVNELVSYLVKLPNFMSNHGVCKKYKIASNPVKWFDNSCMNPSID
jgi:hypothetical protein